MKKVKLGTKQNFRMINTIFGGVDFKNKPRRLEQVYKTHSSAKSESYRIIYEHFILPLDDKVTYISDDNNKYYVDYRIVSHNTMKYSVGVVVFKKEFTDDGACVASSIEKVYLITKDNIYDIEIGSELELKGIL